MTRREAAAASVSSVMIGLSRVGLAGLKRAFERAEESGLVEREPLVDLMLQVLAELNFIPPARRDDYGRAVWREYVRHRGGEIRDLYSEIEVVVRGEPGEALDRFEQTLRSVFEEYELRPVVTREPAEPGGSDPELLIGGEVVLAGAVRAAEVRRAVRRRISDW